VRHHAAAATTAPATTAVIVLSLVISVLRCDATGRRNEEAGAGVRVSMTSWMTVLVGLTFTVAAAPAVAALAAGHATTVRVVGCAEHVEAGGPLPSDREVREARRTSIVMGAITFWGLRRAEDHRFGPGGARGDDGWKAGISVRGYETVTVRVAARDRAWVALDYVPRAANRRPRYVADADSAVRFMPCPRGTRSLASGRLLGAGTGWAGGFLVARRGCATLLVRRAGVSGSKSVRIGFGASCR
jgi:hypothetical protein